MGKAIEEIAEDRGHTIPHKININNIHYFIVGAVIIRRMGRVITGLSEKSN